MFLSQCSLLHFFFQCKWCVCVFFLMLIGYDREQGSDALGEIAHYESWNQAVITARRGRQHLSTKIHQKEGKMKDKEDKNVNDMINVPRKNHHLLHERNFMLTAANVTEIL